MITSCRRFGCRRCCAINRCCRLLQFSKFMLELAVRETHTLEDMQVCFVFAALVVRVNLQKFALWLFNLCSEMCVVWLSSSFPSSLRGCYNGCGWKYLLKLITNYFMWNQSVYDSGCLGCNSVVCRVVPMFHARVRRFWILLLSEDKGTMFLQNVGTVCPVTQSHFPKDPHHPTKQLQEKLHFRTSDLTQHTSLLLLFVTISQALMDDFMFNGNEHAWSRVRSLIYTVFSCVMPSTKMCAIVYSCTVSV